MTNLNNEHPNAIILHKIYFNEIAYRFLEPIGIPKDEIKRGKLEIKLNRSCIGLGNDRFIVTMKVIGYQEGGFNFTVVCSGEFTVPDEDPIDQKDILSHSCLAIIFPFVREKIMHLVNNDGMYNLIIQPISVVEAFKDSPPMEIVYLNKPETTDSEDSVLDFLSSLNDDDDPTTNTEPEVRSEMIRLLHEVKGYIRKRKIDGSIVISEDGYNELSMKAYQYLESLGKISSVDGKISPSMFDFIMEQVHIPIKFVIFNDSENDNEAAYVIIKKSKEILK